MYNPDQEPSRMLKNEAVIHVSIPFTDRRYSFSENDEFTKAVRALDILRLSGIRQLGLKTLSESHKDSPYTNPIANRRSHVLATALIAVEIGINVGLGEEDLDKLRAGGLLHDRKMPALGDTTQSLDPTRLSEKHHWKEDLPESALEYFDQHNITIDELDDMIHNKGLRGSILNIADRIAYVLGDLKQLNRPPLHPTQGDIYKDVARDEKTGELFFKDPSRLRFFLWERAELFNNFYIDPEGLAREFIIASLIAQFYDPFSTENDSLTPRRLRQMTDEELITYLATKCDIDEEDFYDFDGWQPKYTKCLTLEEALDELDLIQKNPELKGLGIKVRKGFKPSTDLKVWDELTMSPVPASDLFSHGMSPYIDELVKETTDYLVVYTDSFNQGLARHIQGQRII